MTFRKYSLALIFPFLLLVAAGCDLLDPETDLEKKIVKLTNEWSVDSVRVREYGYFPSQPPGPLQTPLAKDTLLPIVKMKFVRVGEALEGTVIQTSRVKGIEVINEYRWRYTDYLELLYPNPNIGFSDVAVIYDVIELTDNQLYFKREENLVAEPAGVRYGSLNRVWKMHR